MKEKETEPEKATSDEIERVLRGIKTATQEKEERERGGHKETFEEEYGRKYEEWNRQPRPIEDVSSLLEGINARPIRKEKGLDLSAYIRNWIKANPGYISNNIDADRVEIANMTDAEIPFEFVDYLIGNANDSIKALQNIHLFGETEQVSGPNDFIESRDIHLLGEIKQIKIGFNKKTKMLFVGVRDAKNTISLYFESEPPFNLKQVDSHLGIYTF